MWGATHTAMGALIYDSTRDEHTRFVRVLLILVGGFVTHWLLDSTGVYHNFLWHGWWDFLYVLGQVVGVLFLLAYCGLMQVTVGVTAWLVWDIEWVFRHFHLWVGQDGFFHKYLTAFTLFSEHSKDPSTVILESVLLITLIYLSRPAPPSPLKNYPWNWFILQWGGIKPLWIGLGQVKTWLHEKIFSAL